MVWAVEVRTSEFQVHKQPGHIGGRGHPMPKFTGHLNESVEELHRYSLRKGELEPLEMAGLVGTGSIGSSRCGGFGGLGAVRWSWEVELMVRI